MTPEDLARMRSWAEAAAGHPTWSVAYAEDVPALLAEIDRLAGLLADIGTTCGWYAQHVYTARQAMADIERLVGGGS